MREHEINARLDRIEEAIVNGSLAVHQFTSEIVKLNRRIETMTDSTKAALDALTAEVNAAVAKIASGAGNAQDLADALAQVKVLSDQLHAANNA